MNKISLSRLCLTSKSRHKHFFRIMRITYILLFAAIFCLHAENAIAQKITLKGENLSLKDYLNTIEKQTEYLFVYDSDVNINEKISLDMVSKPIKEILDNLSSRVNLSYSQEGSYIILTARRGEHSNMNITQQTKTITGIVTDINGEPIIGANVVEKGTTNGIITDLEGKFSLEITFGGNGMLAVSYIGYVPSEAAIGNKNSFSIILKEDSEMLDEVVVVGYGTQKKATVTGAVSQISGDIIKQTPVANLSNSLAGRLPGVVANNRTGEPGNDFSEILIRGKGTLGNSKPLYVIDGVANRGGIERLNPSDIESISVLKDASASIYGAQAANGVILVTTKRGSDSKPTISYEGNFSLSQNTRTPHLMNAYQYMVYNDEANTYLGREQIWKDIKGGYVDGTIDKLQYGDTDWFDATFRTFAPQTQHSLSVRGGNERVKYYISGGYLYQEPGYKNTNQDFNTMQVRSNLDAKITKDFTVSLELATRQENRNLSNWGSGTFFYEAFMAYPYLYDFYPNGLPGPGIAKGNNLALLATGVTGYNKTKDNFFNTKVAFDLKMPWIVDGLYVAGYAAFDSQFRRQKTLNDQWDAYRYNPSTQDYDKVPTSDKIDLSQRFDENNINTIHIKLGYEKRFADHSVNAFVAYEQSKQQGDWFSAYRRDFLSSSVDYLFAGGDNKKENDGKGSISARQNYFGRLSYGYKDKYMAEFTMRYDGSQNFATDARWGLFPGISAGWRISEEEFFKEKVSFINELKLRASWGKLGNDRVDPFQYLSTYQMTNGAHFGTDPMRYKGFTVGRLNNPFITWEKVDTKNIGFESQWLNGLLGLDVEYFHSLRTDILTPKQASVPDYTGLTLPDQNIGEVVNQGIEASLIHRNTVENVSYYIGGNFTFTRNKILFFDEAANVPDWQRRTGYSIDSWLVYKTDGIYQTKEEVEQSTHLMNAQPGDIKYLDIDDDGKITDNDRVRIHQSAIPEIVYGINMGGRWKNIELNILWTGQARAKQMIRPFGYNIDEHYFENRWMSAEQTPTSLYPRAFNTQDQINNKDSDFWLKDASFLRLKNVEIAYNFPRKWLEKVRVQNLRVFVSGFNLFSIDKIKILDPEGTNSSGMYYPQQRMYNLGVNVSF